MTSHLSVHIIQSEVKFENLDHQFTFSARIDTLASHFCHIVTIKFTISLEYLHLTISTIEKQK